MSISNSLTVKFFLLLLFVMPNFLLAESHYAGSFSVSYGVIDIHKSVNTFVGRDETPNYKPLTLQTWLAKNYSDDIDLILKVRIEEYNGYGQEILHDFVPDDSPDLSIEIDSGIIKNYNNFSIGTGIKFLRSRTTEAESETQFKLQYDHRSALGIYFNGAFNLNESNTLMTTVGFVGNQRHYSAENIDGISYLQLLNNYKLDDNLDFMISHLKFRGYFRDIKSSGRIRRDNGAHLDRTRFLLSYKMPTYTIGFSFDKYIIRNKENGATRLKTDGAVDNGDAFIINLSIPFGTFPIKDKNRLMIEHKPNIAFSEAILSGPAE
tara:strand:+ start:71 stop:1033 length:963 start_codon:yes stop_codon:yes gene_type:complete